ncbi:histidine phosphatase family protein [Vibrio sp. NTOU-M3]|uniref:histidine phosphatase family protein n=1 Tax=Vibrio sp. NTOU-M3 TaxID=3234954 RepID=UPI00349F848D
MSDIVNIYLLRHAKVDSPPALNGRSDVPVVFETQRKLCDLLEHEIRVSKVITSPLSRCAELATLYSQAVNAELEIVSCFQEMDFGSFDGKPFDELQSEWSQLEVFWQNPAENTLPNAESLQHFYTRVSTAWMERVGTFEEDTLVVCHGGTIRMILASVLQLDWKNPQLYSSLQIGYQSLTHLQVIQCDKPYQRVITVGRPIE